MSTAGKSFAQAILARLGRTATRKLAQGRQAMGGVEKGAEEVVRREGGRLIQALLPGPVGRAMIAEEKGMPAVPAAGAVPTVQFPTICSCSRAPRLRSVHADGTRAVYDCHSCAKKGTSLPVYMGQLNPREGTIRAAAAGVPLLTSVLEGPRATQVENALMLAFVREEMASETRRRRRSSSRSRSRSH